MNIKRICLIGLLLIPIACYGEKAGFNIVWKRISENSSVQAQFADLVQVKRIKGKTTCLLDNVNIQPGPNATIVNVLNGEKSFSFFLRDVSSRYPIWIPEYEVVVLPAEDKRNYGEVVASIKSRNLFSKIEKIEMDEEASFEEAFQETRSTSAPIWLGISRDMRVFEVCEELPDAFANDQTDKTIIPMDASSKVVDESISPNKFKYNYSFGRGVGPRHNITRGIEDGIYPIYHSDLQDDDVSYSTVSFVCLEKSDLVEENVQGTHYLISDKYAFGHQFTETQQKQLDSVLASETGDKEEVVMFIHTSIKNNAEVPRYSWLKIPYAFFDAEYSYDTSSGYSKFKDGRVYCISYVNGRPAANEELTILLQPGQELTVDYILPHRPVSVERANSLAEKNVETAFQQCKKYWRWKLEEAAKIKVPEQRIQNMIEAGLLDLDLITFGKKGQGVLAANVGVYAPIGTESAPIIQFYESMGLFDQARGCLQYFLENQHEDGSFVNFCGYTIETGAALWSFGEYYRYTHDLAWLQSIKPQLLKSCQYLIDWRNANMKEINRGKGYGMVDGKVADPVDPYHQFMLNAYAYLGFKRMCEVFGALGAEETPELDAVENEWHKDILDAIRSSFSTSPVVPLTDGTWCPTCAPWADMPTSRFFYQNAGNFRSHGTFTTPDCLLGPLHLVWGEVLDMDSIEASFLLKYNRDIFLQGNSAFSQPYYSKHNSIQASLGMVKPFLNTYYYTAAPHIDKETGTFWEHYFRATPHKTHEEGNFLMETRLMLYLERGDTLKIFNVIPRKWMENGNEIVLDSVRSYFGILNVKAVSNIMDGKITATISSDKERKPSVVTIRLPHPDGKKAISVKGGVYDPETESIRIDYYSGKAEVELFF